MRDFYGEDLLKAANLCEAFGTRSRWVEVSRDVAAGFSYREAAVRNGFPPHGERVRQIVGTVIRRAKRIWITVNKHGPHSELLATFLDPSTGQYPYIKRGHSNGP